MQIVVSGEQDAFDLIKRALKNELGDQFELKFEGWPKIQVTLEGDGYHSTITPSLMAGLIELQHGINRTYAQLVLQQPDAKSLKDIDKRELEFKAKVEDGCSLVTVDLTEFAQKLVTDMVGKMDSTQVVIFGVVGATLWAATTMYKHYANSEIKKKELDVDADKLVKLSQQETERLEIVANALAAQPRLAAVKEHAAETSLGLLKGISDAESINLNGVELTRAEAKQVSTSARGQATEVQVNGNYRILYVDTSREDEIRIKVRYLADGREFIAKFRDDSLDKEHLKALQEAEWAKGAVYLSVNAAELRGQITTATIVSATQQPLVHDENVNDARDNA